MYGVVDSVKLSFECISHQVLEEQLARVPKHDTSSADHSAMNAAQHTLYGCSAITHGMAVFSQK